MHVNETDINVLECYKNSIAGNAEATEKLVTVYSDLLVYYAYKGVGNFFIAEDIMEDAFVSLLVRHPSVSKEAELSAFLYTAAEKGIRRYLKQKSKTKFAPSGGFLGEIRQPTEDEFAKKYIIGNREDVVKCAVIHSKDADSGRILILSMLKGTDKADIARITGKDAAFVTKTVSTGNIQLIKTLEKINSGVNTK